MKVRYIGQAPICNEFGSWDPGDVKEVPDGTKLPGYYFERNTIEILDEQQGLRFVNSILGNENPEIHEHEFKGKPEILKKTRKKTRKKIREKLNDRMDRENLVIGTMKKPQKGI